MIHTYIHYMCTYINSRRPTCCSSCPFFAAKSSLDCLKAAKVLVGLPVLNLGTPLSMSFTGSMIWSNSSSSMPCKTESFSN